MCDAAVLSITASWVAVSVSTGPGVTEKVGPTQALAPVSVTAETGPT